MSRVLQFHRSRSLTLFCPNILAGRCQASSSPACSGSAGACIACGLRLSTETTTDIQRHPAQEYEHRFKVWLDNLEFIVEYNAKRATHWVRLQSLVLTASDSALVRQDALLNTGCGMLTAAAVHMLCSRFTILSSSACWKAGWTALSHTNSTSNVACSFLRVQLGLNHLADLTHEEFKATRLGYRADLMPKKDLTAIPYRYESASPPEQVDWVKDGAVTKVKNQQQVGDAPSSSSACGQANDKQ